MDPNTNPVIPQPPSPQPTGVQPPVVSPPASSPQAPIIQPQPIASGTGDIILTPDAPRSKSRRPLIIVFVVLGVLLAVGIAVAAFMLQRQSDQSTNDDLDATLSAYASKVNELEQIFAQVYNQAVESTEFFAESTHQALHEDFDAFLSLSQLLSDFSAPAMASSELKGLQDIINDRYAIYQDDIANYDLFYDCVVKAQPASCQKASQIYADAAQDIDLLKNNQQTIDGHIPFNILTAAHEPIDYEASGLIYHRIIQLEGANEL